MSAEIDMETAIMAAQMIERRCYTLYARLMKTESNGTYTANDLMWIMGRANQIRQCLGEI